MTKLDENKFKFILTSNEKNYNHLKIPDFQNKLIIWCIYINLFRVHNVIRVFWMPKMQYFWLIIKFFGCLILKSHASNNFLKLMDVKKNLIILWPYFIMQSQKFI